VSHKRTTPRPPSDSTCVEILHRLVATPSPSDDEAAAVRRFLRDADAIAFETRVDHAGNGHALRRASRTPSREILLLGHIDTVPGDIPVRLEDGLLHGRGSVDAKGPLAAMLCGAARASLPDPVSLRVVAAACVETQASHGARNLLSSDIPAPAACIIGEPSGWDGVTIAYKGRLVVRARVERENGHSAGRLGSAPDQLLAWIMHMRTLATTLSPHNGPVFDRLQTTVDSLDSSNDGIRQSARAVLGLRLPHALPPQRMEAEIRAATPSNVHIEFLGAEPAHETRRNDPVVRALSTAIRAEGGRPRPTRKTGTADFNLVGPAWACPIAAYGPGNSALDHTPHERIDLAEFLRSVRVIARALETIARQK